MSEGRYIWCRNCDQIHHVTPFDKEPTYSFLHNEEREVPTDDWREFMRRHAGHSLEGLQRVKGTHLSSGSPGDPMREGYLEVTNGRDRFLLRSSRKSIEEPLRFELIKGKRITTRMTLEIQEWAIQKEMQRHFRWAREKGLSEQKINLFTGLLKELITELDPRIIPIDEDSLMEASVGYGRFHESLVEALVDKCGPHFSPEELKDLKTFVESHRAADDVMAILIRQHWELES